MIKPLKDAVTEIERLPVEQQEEAAELLRTFAAELSADDAEGLAVARESLEAYRRGEVASDAAMDVLREPWR
jgi:hypothetical protein